MTFPLFVEVDVRLTGSASELKFLPRQEDDPARRKPDIALARDLLGWQPEVALEDGPVRTIEYFRGALEHLELR